MINGMKTGLVSVSFRMLSPDAIIALAEACGLDAIEWGGDVHVPVGAIELAEYVGRQTRAHGMEVACYGSYCRMTDDECSDASLKALIDTAKALGAPLIRVWAGKKGSREASQAERETVIRNTRRLADMAAVEGMETAFEYHGGTLTDDACSARALLDAVGRKNAGCLWQPPVGMAIEDCLASIESVAPYIRNIHVFSWSDGEPVERYSLAAGVDKWRKCLNAISALSGERTALLEFFRNDEPEQMKLDARCLKNWIRGEWKA